MWLIYRDKCPLAVLTTLVVRWNDILVTLQEKIALLVEFPFLKQDCYLHVIIYLDAAFCSDL